MWTSGAARAASLRQAQVVSNSHSARDACRKVDAALCQPAPDQPGDAPVRTQSFWGPLGSRRPHSTPAPPSGPGWLLPEWEARQSLSTLCREQTRGLQGLAGRARVTRSAWGPQVLLNTTPTRPTALPGTLGQALGAGRLCQAGTLSHLAPTSPKEAPAKQHHK